MTAAEFKTLRESLGMSVQTLADWLGVSQVRTVQRWEEGERRVPADVAERLRGLDAAVERPVRAAVETYREAATKHGHGQVALVRYRTAEDLARYRPDMARLPRGVHVAMIDRLRRALESEGATVGIVYMDPPAYEAWRAAHDMPDGDATRAAWAGQVLDATQPPTSSARA